MHRTPLAAVLLAAAVAIVLPASASAITLTHHVLLPHGVTDRADRHEVVVTTVPPADSDDDGCPDRADAYAGPGCKAPAPPPVTTPPPAATAPTTAPVAPTVAPTSGGCPSYMAGEATSPTAVNASSGARGCYQVTPGTAAAMGSACSDVNSTSCVAAICAAQGNSAWASSGSTPCDYLGQP